MSERNHPRAGYEHLDFDPFEIVEEDHPERCPSVTAKKGQCRFRAVPGGKNCYIHAGANTLREQRKRSLAAYRESKWLAEIQRHAQDDDVKNLRSEVGILRVLMQEQLARCQDATDLLLMSGPISDLVLKIDKVVNSCHKLESNMGQLLDKQAIINFASRVIKVVTDVLKEEQDAEKVNEIADGIMNILGSLGTEEPDSSGA
jgi:hypothetical protein